MMTMKKLSLILALSCLFGLSSAGRGNSRNNKLKSVIGKENVLSSENPRGGRLFSLFNIVTFKQTSCTLNSDATHSGVCMTNSECSNKGGSADGNCASGFGVCCAFTVKTCPGTVSQNCTYVQNPEYPSATTENSCSIQFNRICDNLCQIRLDFETLTTAQPPNGVADTIGICGDTNTDTVTVTSPTGLSPPVVCGTLTGQHMFLETGNTGTAGKIDFAFGSVSATRTYQFKVTYYTCDSLNKAPADCVQYFTGTSGTVESYNWPNQLLADQQYASCFRQEVGYCGIVYQQTISSSPSFELYDAEDTLPAPAAAETLACLQTFIEINNVLANTLTAAMASGRFCGNILSQKQDDTVPGQITATGTPFRITTHTDADNLGGTAGFAGYSIDYSQRPCGVEN